MRRPARVYQCDAGRHRQGPPADARGQEHPDTWAETWEAKGSGRPSGRAAARVGPVRLAPSGGKIATMGSMKEPMSLSAFGVKEIIGDKMRCHICGRLYRHVGVHAVQAHGLTADEYREEFGLNRDTGLIGPETHEIQAHNAMRPGHPGTKVLLAKGLPDKEAALRGSQQSRRLEWKRGVSERQKDNPAVKSRLDAARALVTPAGRSRGQWLYLLRLSPTERKERYQHLAEHRWKGNGLKTHCLRGHAFSEENTRIVPRPDGRQGRACRACDRWKAAERRRQFGQPSRSTGVRDAQRERQERAYTLRQEGLTYSEIAAKLGYSNRCSAFSSIRRMVELRKQRDD